MKEHSTGPAVFLVVDLETRYQYFDYRVSTVVGLIGIWRTGGR